MLMAYKSQNWLLLEIQESALKKKKIINSLALRVQGLPGGSTVKNLRTHLQGWRRRLYPWIRKIPWRRRWQSAPVILPGKSHGQRRLAGYSPRDHKRVRQKLATKQQEHKLPSFRTFFFKLTITFITKMLRMMLKFSVLLIP